MENNKVTAKKAKINYVGLAKINYVGLAILVFIILVISAGMLGWYHNQTLEVKQLKISEVSALSKVESLKSSLQGTSDTLTICKTELAKLRERMSDIKNVDDLLRRDIFLYIDKKFQLIPKTVSIEISKQVVDLSKAANVSPELVIGIIQVESAFNPMAISSKNARGLMQVMPEWAPKFNLKKVTDLHDIDTNIESGIKVLKIHIEEAKGNISKGLYLYVGKSDSYAGQVYEAMGKFIAFRTTVDDDDESDIDINGDAKEKEDPNATKH